MTHLCHKPVGGGRRSVSKFLTSCSPSPTRSSNESAVEGRNLRIEIRHAAGDAGRLRTYAAELAVLMPDVLVSTGCTPRRKFNAGLDGMWMLFSALLLTDTLGHRRGR